LNSNRYHSFRYANDDKKDLMECDELISVLRLEEAVADGVLYRTDSTVEEKKTILKVTPDYKYYKYLDEPHGNHADFWKERFVFEVMEDVFSDQVRDSPIVKHYP
jgi:hypothetical protein